MTTWDECKHMKKREKGKQNIRWCHKKHWCHTGKNSINKEFNIDRCEGCTFRESRVKL